MYRKVRPVLQYTHNEKENTYSIVFVKNYSPNSLDIFNAHVAYTRITVGYSNFISQEEIL